MGPIGCPETSVRNYHYSLRDIPEECGSHGVGVYTLFWAEFDFLLISADESTASFM